MINVNHNLMSMKESLIYVDDSPIDGKGLFTRRYIGPGELIGVLDGAPTLKDGEHVLWRTRRMCFTLSATSDLSITVMSRMQRISTRWK